MYDLFLTFAQSSLPYLLSTVGIAVECFLVGVLLSQKVKDFVSSTPAVFRTSMSEVERKAKADVHSAIGDIFVKLNPPEAPDASAE